MGQMGGASTGAIHKPAYDNEHRPITAGGFVDHGLVVFQDVSQQSGLASWKHQVGDGSMSYIVESLGSGVALLDFDQDGWLDIYLVNAMTYAALAGTSQPPHAALFHNNHDGTFTDVAEHAGVALGDWSTGATFGDYDGDGRLDLFVPGYTAYDFAKPPKVDSDAVVSNTCKFRGVSTFCGPRGLQGAHDHLFHNNGNGTFDDVSERAGVSDKPGYYGLVSLFVDLDDDGHPDLLVGNDSTPNYLYRNKGDGSFEDYSFESGYGVNGEGRETATMGIAVGGYDNSGRLGILNTDFSDDYKVLYRNDGKLSFTDVSATAGFADLSSPYLGWGDAFLDFDLDGRSDIFMANGHVYPQVDQHDWGTSFAQKPLLLRNNDGSKFTLVQPVKGTGLALATTARGAAFGDLFNDGHTDVVINNLVGSPTVLRNVLKTGHHWIEFKLIGGGKVPQDAIGTKVFVTANHMRQRADVLSGGSFASSSDPRVLFGIGDATVIDLVEVIWPDGKVQKITVGKVDCLYQIDQLHGATIEYHPK